MSTKDDEPRRRQVFTGDSRLIFCRDVSEFDCNRVMADDADNCGIETHSRVVPVGQLFGESRFGMPNTGLFWSRRSNPVARCLEFS